MSSWNNFCHKLIKAIKDDVLEDDYHQEIESSFCMLGWEIDVDIVHKPSLPIGHGNYIQPDIVLKREGKPVLAIEVKRPNNEIDEKQETQLISYMRQLKLPVGLYFGSDIQIFYEGVKMSKAKSVCTIDIEKNNEVGQSFVDMFCHDEFDLDKIVKYCEERVKYLADKKDLTQLKDSLIGATCDKTIKSIITESLISKGYSEDMIKQMFDGIEFINKSDMVVPTPKPTVSKKPTPSNSTVPATPIDKQQLGHLNLFALNGGEFLSKRLFVREVVKTYMEEHAPINYSDIENAINGMKVGFKVILTMDELKAKFANRVDDPSVRYVIVDTKNKANKKNEDMVLTSSDGIRFAVCSQWEYTNILKLFEFVEKQGWTVEGKAKDSKK